MSQEPVAKLSHFGICCADVEQSVEFYTQALGFERVRTLDPVGPPYDILTELPGVTFCAHFMQCGDASIELIGFADGASGSTGRRPMQQIGFTHMTVAVPDVDAAAARIARHGGKVLEHTRIDSPYGPMVFCTDPNGVRIELIQGGS